jgi:hypothetical protein
MNHNRGGDGHRITSNIPKEGADCRRLGAIVLNNFAMVEEAAHKKMRRILHPTHFRSLSENLSGNLDFTGFLGFGLGDSYP